MENLILMNTWGDKIPSENVFMLQKQLEVVDEKELHQLMAIPLNSPFLWAKTEGGISLTLS